MSKRLWWWVDSYDKVSSPEDELHGKRDWTIEATAPNGSKGRFIPVEIKPPEEIIASGCCIVGVPVDVCPDMATRMPGSAQIPCSLCNALMWFAPSGQAILAAGKNPALCPECAAATIKTRA